jgi:hypothetical protein
MTPANQPDESVAASPGESANGLRTSRLATAGVDFVANSLISPPALSLPKPSPLRPRQQPVKKRSTACGLSDLRLGEHAR